MPSASGPNKARRVTVNLSRTASPPSAVRPVMFSQVSSMKGLLSNDSFTRIPLSLTRNVARTVLVWSRAGCPPRYWPLKL
jgi:hypothetical protein